MRSLLVPAKGQFFIAMKFNDYLLKEGNEKITQSTAIGCMDFFSDLFKVLCQ